MNNNFKMVKQVIKQEAPHTQGSSAKNRTVLKKAVIMGGISILSLFFAGIMLTGCGDDDGDVAANWSVTNVNASVVNGNAYVNPREESEKIDSVKLFVGGINVLSRARYNGNFNINLPANVESHHLIPIVNLFGENADLNFSDKRAQISVGVFVGFRYVEEQIDVEEGQKLPLREEFRGQFRFGDPGRDVRVNLIYVDRDVIISGGSLDIDSEGNFSGKVTSTSMSFKKGWNYYYSLNRVSERGISSNYMTTQPNSDYKWYFIKDWEELN